MRILGAHWIGGLVLVAALAAPAPGAEPSVSQEWAAQIDALTFDRLPAEIVQKLRLSVADSVGVIASTRTLEEVTRYRELTLTGGRQQATELVAGTRVPRAEAAAVNAFAIHGHEIDDSNLRCQLRASCVAVPAVLAAAEEADATGRETLVALAVAYHVGDRLGIVTNLQPEGELHARGWMPSSVCGIVGSAAGAAKAVKLPPEQIASAIGLAAGGANGLFQYYRDGSDEKRIHVARSQALAVESVVLARGGFRGAAHAIEGEAGLLHALGLKFTREELVADFGRFDGVMYVMPKFYACSQGVIPWLETAARIRAGRPFAATDVRSITVHIAQPAESLYARKINEFKPPASTIDAQLSVNVGLALLLTKGDAFVGDYTAENLRDPAVLALAGKVRAVTDAERTGLVEIELADGSRLAARYDPATLTKPYPADESIYRRKFDRLTAGYSAESRDRLWRCALALEAAPSARAWIAELAACLKDTP